MTTNQRNVTAEPKQASYQFLISFIIFKCISIVFGVLGNIGVIIFNVFMNKEKSPTTWLIVNLSITDLLVCLTIYPIWIVELVQIVSGIQSDEEFFCKFIYSSGGMSICLSILTLLAISFDKYLFITWPLKYPILMTWQRVRILVCTMWVWALAFLPFSVIYIDTGEVRGVCTASNEFVLFTFIVYIYIPLTLIIFFNYKIFKIARRQRRRIAARSMTQYNLGMQAGNLTNEQTMQTRSSTNDQNELWQRITKELKQLKTFLIVIGVLLVCFIPYSLAVSLHNLVCNCIPVTLHIIFSELIAVNSIINPFIYGIRHKKYRNGYGRLVRILCTFLKLNK